MAPDVVCVDCGGDPGGGGGGGSGSSSIKLTYYDVNPQQHTIAYTLSNGVSMIVDDELGEVHLSNQNGSWQLSLDDVLNQYADGDSSKAAAERSSIHNLLADPLNTAMFAASAPAQSQVSGRGSASPMLINGPGGNYFYCDDFDFDCGYSWYEIDGWGSYDFGYWNDPIITPDYQGPMNYDDWNWWRLQQCDAERTDALAMVATAAITLGTCATVETGVGALACGGSIILLGTTSNALDKDISDCNSNYPGGGGW